MEKKKIVQIRDSIAAARAEEAKKHSLEQHLSGKVTSLHKMIALPESQETPALIEFITRYIEHVPDLIEAMTEMSRSAGIFDSTYKFLVIAENYFLRPPEVVTEEHQGLHALIDEAYLAHRLLEEVNDRMTLIAGAPLIPMDMTKANLIIHTILGESFANELDLTVHYSIESMFRKEEFIASDAFLKFIEQHKREGWKKDLEKWPCLAGDSSIEIKMGFGDNQNRGNIH